MYTVVENKFYSFPKCKFMVVGEDHGTTLLLGCEKDCQVFAYMMNKAEKEMCFVNGKLPLNDAVSHNLPEEFWPKVKKQLDNDKKLMEKEVVHLSKGDILGPTYCGIPFDLVPHSSTLVREDVTCLVCKGAYLRKDIALREAYGKKDKGCGETRVNFREFI